MMRYQEDAISRLRYKEMFLGLALCLFSTSSAYSQANGTSDVSKLKVTSQSSGQELDMTEQELLNAERALLDSLTARAKESAAPSKPIVEENVKPVIQKVEQPIQIQNPVAPDAKAMAKVESAPVKQAIPEAQPVSEINNSQPAVVLQPDSDSLRLRQQLAAANAKINSLVKDVDSLRGKLSIAETEVNRLSSLVDQKNKSTLTKYSLPETTKPRLPAAPAIQQQQIQAAQAQPVPAVVKQVAAQNVQPPARDLPIATVAVEKAELRLGAGTNHSSLMSLAKGSRLVVEARQGEWYRVFAPNGERAWVHSKSVVFGEGTSPMNDASATRVRGYDANAEDEAFRNFSKQTGMK